MSAPCEITITIFLNTQIQLQLLKCYTKTWQLMIWPIPNQPLQLAPREPWLLSMAQYKNGTYNFHQHQHVAYLECKKHSEEQLSTKQLGSENDLAIRVNMHYAVIFEYVNIRQKESRAWSRRLLLEASRHSSIMLASWHALWMTATNFADLEKIRQVSTFAHLQAL